MGNIISNIKAQGQKIYSSTKGLILEDGLVKNSLGEAIDKVSGKHQSDYVGSLKVMQELDTKRLNEMTRTRGQALKKTPDKMSILGNSLDKSQLSKVGKTASNRVAIAGSGFPYANMDKTYGKFMKKTKGAIGMNMAGNIAGNYYINPLKDGISAIKTTGFTNNTNLHKSMARIGGTALGVTAIGGAASSIASSANSEDLKQTNAKLRVMYDEGRL